MALDHAAAALTPFAVAGKSRLMVHSALLNVMIGAARKAARALKRATSANSRSFRFRSKARPISRRPRTTAPKRRSMPNSRKGRPGYGLPGRGRRFTRRRRQNAPLDRRSARRHHQFSARHSAFCLLHPLERQGKSRSCVYSPTTDELTAERGAGAFVNDRRLRVAAPNLSDAVVATGMPHLGRWQWRANTD